MAVQDNKKVIGDKPGFVSPQKGVVFSPNQNNQGGSGGAASSANPSGLSKKPNEYKPPASTRSNVATEDPVGISNKLEAGAKAIYNAPKTIGSTLIDAAKGTGNAIVGAGVGLANMASSDGSMRSTPKYNVDNVKNKIGSIVDSAITPSNYTSVVTNGLSRMGIGSKESAPVPSSNVTAPSVSPLSPSDTNITDKFQAGLNSSPVTPNLNKITSGVRDDIAERSNESRFDIDPKNYGTSSGKGGQFAYTKNEDGSISKLNLSTGSRQGLGSISSIGPNGTNSDGSPLSAKDQKALDNSKQMISDWQDYKRQKEASNLRGFIQANLGNQYITSSQRQEATDRLNAIEKGDIDKQQIASQEGVQARTLGMTARKNAFDEAKGTAELGFKQSENLLKAREQIFKEGSEAQKAWAESSKNMDSPLTQLTKYQSLGQTVTPDIARAAYEGDLSGIDNKEDYVQKLGQLLKENKINKQVADMLVVDYDTQR